MIYDHVVKYNGKYYASGTDVPTEESFSDDNARDNTEPPFSDSDIELETTPHMYTYEELGQMTVKEMRRIAEDKGFKLSKISKDDIINEFLSKQ